MSSDSMRYNLVTTFVCSRCGNKLALTYQTKNTFEYAPEKDDGITGAAKVEQRIGIHPCSKCYGEAIAPLESLRNALDAIRQSADQGSKS